MTQAAEMIEEINERTVLELAHTSIVEEFSRLHLQAEGGGIGLLYFPTIIRDGFIAILPLLTIPEIAGNGEERGE